MTRKEAIAHYEDLKDKMASRFAGKPANCGFRQVMKKMDTINKELIRLYREKE